MPPYCNMIIPFMAALVKERVLMNSNIVKGEYGKYKVLDKCIVVGHYFFNSIDEIERHRYYRLINKLKNIDNVLDEAIKVLVKYMN